MSKEKSFKLRFEDAVMTATKKQLTSTQKLVALAWLWRCTYETGFINESHKGKTSQLEVAKRTGFSEKAVRTATKELISKGWMAEIEAHQGSVSVYQLLIPDFNPGTSYQGTPELGTEVKAEPRNDVPTTPERSTDNKNDKNVTTKNESKNEASAAPQLLLASDNDGFSDSSSLYDEVAVGLVEEEDGADPGTTYRGYQDDEDEWTISENMIAAHVRQAAKWKLTWDKDDIADVIAKCVARKDDYPGTAKELVDEVIAEMDGGDDW